MTDLDGDGIPNTEDVCPGFDDLSTTYPETMACYDWDGDGLVGTDDWPLCTYTDAPGSNPAVRGSVSGFTGTEASPNYVAGLEEICASDTQVEETYCNSGDPFIQTVVVDCADGEVCHEGACKTMECIDPDNTYDDASDFFFPASYETQTGVSLYINDDWVSLDTDRCSTGGGLYEVYCDGYEVKEKFFDCVLHGLGSCTGGSGQCS